MWTYSVVVDAPGLDDLARFLDRGEPLRMETRIAEPAVERFDHRVVGRFAGAAQDESDTMARGPGIEGLGDELRPVVHADLLWQARDTSSRFRHCGTPFAGD
jgi:hypothetical protein